MLSLCLGNDQSGAINDDESGTGRSLVDRSDIGRHLGTPGVH